MAGLATTSSHPAAEVQLSPSKIQTPALTLVGGQQLLDVAALHLICWAYPVNGSPTGGCDELVGHQQGGAVLQLHHALCAPCARPGRRLHSTSKRVS